MVEEVYRQAASVFLLREQSVCSSAGCDEKLYSILLLHKPRKNDAWQLPQGGVEKGETIQEAGLRELQEEAGIAPVRVLGESTHAYSYDFPESYRRFRADNVCGQKIHFFFALADKNAAICVDEHEVNQYAWVTEDQLLSYIHRENYLQIIRLLFAEVRVLLSSAL
ncbi:hypothetical protein A3D11_02705 [Candidatus Peribacteria bacterium RIFCSPHIGHO2_02_FULL_49_16]|nr:MAG: hypothetical protein A2880_01855 [Candidatus Peribacteria bacterium RIFCSPHIGHO2_01_FULL_49_38]OGJ58504.1 MAG: hypothetical protein A3D11_02705 [Candidatus Peribacteria bacterium RIFCSPHIGHO2_02_FULL_49_16]